MRISKIFSLTVFALFIFSLVPSVDYNGGTVSVSLNQTHEAQAFQSSFGIREDYSIETDYYVTLDHGDELCSYLNTQTISGSYCDHGWDLCGVSGSPNVSSVWTGESICVSY